ncbi:MAG: recombinase family protein, partial [Actinophytocola sp.]|nr:recombinase family protein [Actinophytocola sp.]
HTGQLTDTQRARIDQLVTDLPAIWHDPATPARERKRIARLLLTDVTACRDRDTITAHMRFPGGQDTTLTVPAPKPIGEQRKTPAQIVATVDELLDEHVSGQIAEILNQRGLTTGTGQPFHRRIVDNIIRTYRLPSRRQRLRDAGMLTPTEMAKLIGINTQTVKAWWRAGIVSGQRYNDKGETLYHPPDPDKPPKRPKTGRPATAR